MIADGLSSVIFDIFVISGRLLIVVHCIQLRANPPSGLCCSLRALLQPIEALDPPTSVSFPQYPRRVHTVVRVHAGAFL